MNKINKKRFGIKRKEYINKKLVLQVLFSIILISIVIITKQFNTDATKKFINATEDKFSESINTSKIVNTFKNSFINVKNKIPFISKKDKNTLYASPVNGGEIYKNYGIIKNDETSYYNHGMDIISDTKSVKSISKGKILKIGENEKLLKYIVVEDQGKNIIYSKVGEAFVNIGDTVKKGDIIGALSEEDKTLHLEIWENGESINPTKLFDIKD